MRFQRSKRNLLFLILPLVLRSVSVGAAEAPKELTSPAELADVGGLMDAVIPNLVNNKGEKVDYAAIKERDYVLFYWSASWCGPCKRFTPKLVETYNKLGGGDRFEVILVSLDRSEADMKAYMQNMQMPWYGIQYDSKKTTGIKSFSGGSIPHLMLIDKEGKILGRGRGKAHVVLNQLIALLGEPSE